MPTTSLSLAGVSGNYPMIGFDLTQRCKPRSSLLCNTDQTQAMMKGNNDVVIQMPNKAAQGYQNDNSTETLTPKEVPDAMKKEALAHALLSS